MKRAVVALVAGAFSCGYGYGAGTGAGYGLARADEPQPQPPPPPVVVWAPKKPQKLLTPDARRYLAPPVLSYWAGTERVTDGELSIAPPRPPEGRGFLPALDDHLSTTSYLRGVSAFDRHGGLAHLFELSSLHDIRGGAVLGVSFRYDARDQSAVGGDATVAMPLPDRMWLVPTLGVGAGAYFAPLVVGDVELRSDRSRPLGASLGIEGSSWVGERERVLGTVGGIYRASRIAAFEERIGVGAWAWPGIGRELALRWITAALQTLDDRTALYERVTLARGAAAPSASSLLPQYCAMSTDVALGVRQTLVSPYGIAVELDEGGQQGTYERLGVALTLYGTLF